jgi:hypothetical protein
MLEEVGRRRLLRKLAGTAVVGWASRVGGAVGRQQATDSWPMFGQDTANTGHAPIATAPTNGVTERWRFRTDDEVASSPAVVDRTVHVGSKDGHLYALDAADGTEQWRFRTDYWMVSSPAVVDRTIHVGSTDATVYALDAADGIEQWRFRTDGWVQSSPAVAGGTVYVGSDDGHLYALDAADGTEQWRFRTNGAVPSSPAVAGGTVYVGSDDGHLYALREGGRTRGSPGVVVPGTDIHLWEAEVAGLALALAAGPASLAAGRRDHPRTMYLGLFLATSLLTTTTLSLGSHLPGAPTPGTPLAYSVAVLGSAVFVVGLAMGGRWLVGRLRRATGRSRGDSDRSVTATDRQASDDRIAQAQSAQAAAAEAREAGEYAAAAEQYAEALDHYEQAREQLPVDDDRHDRIETALEDVRSASRAVVQQRDRRAELRQRLAAAEDDLATATREHSRGNETVARIRYRQARDRLDEALDTLEDGDLEPPLTVQVDADDRPDLREVAGLDGTDRLTAAGYGTPDTIRDASVDELIDVGGIDERLAARILAWSHQQEAESRSFDGVADIRTRQELAVWGFEQVR